MFKFKKNKKDKEKARGLIESLMNDVKEKEIQMLKELGVALIKDVENLKEEIEKMKSDKKFMVSEMERRDKAFMEFLKVELTVVKTIDKDKEGKDYVKSTYKLIKK